MNTMKIEAKKAVTAESRTISERLGLLFFCRHHRIIQYLNGGRILRFIVLRYFVLLLQLLEDSFLGL